MVATQMFFGIFTPKIWGKIPTHFDLTPIFRMGGWWKTTPRQSHTPGAHPRQSPYPTMKGFPLQPVGTGCSGCVPVRCVETTLERFPWDNPSLRIIYIPGGIRSPLESDRFRRCCLTKFRPPKLRKARSLWRRLSSVCRMWYICHGIFLT